MTFVIYSGPSRSSKLVSHNICLSYWSSVAAGTECIRGTVCCKASRFFLWHSCPSVDMFVAKVALLHLVVLGAMPVCSALVPWVRLCCCCWNSDSVEISPADAEREFLDGLL